MSSNLIAGLAIGVGAVALGGAAIYAFTKQGKSVTKIYPTERTTVLAAPRYTYDPFSGRRHKWNGIPWTRRVSVNSAYHFPHPRESFVHRSPYRH